jgi:nucleoside-triphosphatase
MAIEPSAGADRTEMTARRATALLLTGRPGVGKTTVVRRVAETLDRAPASARVIIQRASSGEAGRSDQKIVGSRRRPGGFYTEEVREEGDRRGFRAVTFDGETCVIADVDFRAPRVGRYGVDVAAIDRLADTALRQRREVTVYIIDEIGKMECLSARFVEAVQALLDSGRTVVATVGQRGAGFIARVKHRPDAELWEVTRQTRDEMPARVLAWLGRTTVL